jgi:hypothetical protein
MSYREAREYAQLYSLQQMFNANMDRYVDSRAEMYAFLSRTALRDRPSAAEFEAGEHIIAKGLVMTDFLREIGNELNVAYTEFLAVGRLSPLLALCSPDGKSVFYLEWVTGRLMHVSVIGGTPEFIPASEIAGREYNGVPGISPEGSTIALPVFLVDQGWSIELLPVADAKLPARKVRPEPALRGEQPGDRFHGRRKGPDV